MKHQFSKYMTSMEITITNPELAKRERKHFYESNRIDFKKEIIKKYYQNGFFDCILLTRHDKMMLERGLIPFRENILTKAEPLFSIHHIKPISCGGKNTIDNTIPLPQYFHSFIHKNIIDPQIKDLKIGDKKRIRGLPNFELITLDLMFDENFLSKYSDILCNKLRIQPKKIQRHLSISDYFENWKKYKSKILVKE